MKFRFKNLGPITQADLELGDLTIIAGRNNTGKTYIAYALYGFLKRWDWSAVTVHAESHQGIRRVVCSLASEAADKGHARSVVGRQTFDRHRSDLAEDVTLPFAKSELASVFGSRSDYFRDAMVELISGLPMDAPPLEARSWFGHRYRVEYEKDEIVISVDSADRRRVETDKHIPILYETYFRSLFPEFAIDPFVLSSERFGISLFYRELDFTKNQVVDLLRKVSEESTRPRSDLFLLLNSTTSRYALPVKDNVDYTRSIPDLQDQQSELSQHRLSTKLRRLTDAYYKVVGDSISITSTPRGSRGFNIPMYLASSSVRGLSDLYFFLQHVAAPNHLLIIDEPESHLDTHNQILMARLLVRCVHAGLKVLITTHSDYFVKELNNLIMMSRDFHGKEDMLKRFKYDHEDTLDPALIRAYIAEDGKLTACSVDKYGMEMPNFDSTIDDINQVANEVSSRILETDGL
ncbi:MAG: AAA family ATPase [Spirochaetaceae bacterium]|nr:AAA family ATPase [Spirochaetaceae bacterium]